MKNYLKIALTCAALSSALCLPLSVSAQGVPVIDATAIANAVQQLVQLQQQYQTMVQQYQQMQQQYQSLTGIRGFGDLLNNPTLRSYVPQNMQSVYNSLKSGGYQSLTSDAQAIRNGVAIYNCDGQTGQLLSVCQQQAYKPAQDQAFVQEAYQTATSRVNDMQSLIDQINNTNDPKGIAELQARIAGEQVAVQNEQAKLNLFKMLSDVQDKMIDQQKRELSYQGTAKRGMTAENLAPVTFQSN